MTTDDLFSELQSMLSEILIDVTFNFMCHVNGNPEDYYEKDEVQGATILEETKEPETDIPVYIDRTYLDKVWTAIFNGFTQESFVQNLKELSDNLISEYFIEQKITKYIGSTEFTPEAYFELIGNVYKRILYDKGENLYKMANVKHTATFDKYDFSSRNRYEIQAFYKELKNTCHDLLVVATEKFETNSSNLRWLKSKTDLGELIVALVEAKAVQTIDFKFEHKAITKEFGVFFNQNLKNRDSLISHTTGNNQEPGQFLKSLVNSYKEYTEKKLKK
jgi:hypothetical protein